MTEKSSKLTNDKCTLSIYQRNVIAKTLQSSHCDLEVVNNTSIHRELIPQEKIAKYIDLQCKKGQECVKNLITVTDMFTNCENWLDALKKDKRDETCNNEIPFVLRWIAETETHPSKDDINGIDLKQLYHTLADMMMGNPIQELDENNTEFLKSVFMETLEDMPNLDDDVKILKETIEKNLISQNETVENDEINLEKLLLDKNLNTFQLPINMMLNKN